MLSHGFPRHSRVRKLTEEGGLFTLLLYLILCFEGSQETGIRTPVCQFTNGIDAPSRHMYSFHRRGDVQQDK